MKFGDKIINFKESEFNDIESNLDMAIERSEMNIYRIDGIDNDLSEKVCRALRQKREWVSEVNIDLEKMAEYFSADKEVLVRIIKWYESNLLDTKFIIS